MKKTNTIKRATNYIKAQMITDTSASLEGDIVYFRKFKDYGWLMRNARTEKFYQASASFIREVCEIWGQWDMSILEPFDDPFIDDIHDRELWPTFITQL